MSTREPTSTMAAIIRESAVRALGIRWLASQGLVTSRVFVLTLAGSLLGLPIVVAAGLVMHVRIASRERGKPKAPLAA